MLGKIYKIEIENFLSFEKNLIKLNDLTVLVGPNASGKSNLIKVLRFIKELTANKTIFNICQSLFHIDNMDQMLFNPKKNSIIKVSYLLNNHLFTYKISFNNKGLVNDESLTSKNKRYFSMITTPNLNNPNEPKKYEYLLNSQNSEQLQTNPEYSFLSRINNISTDLEPDIADFLKFLRNMSFYSFNSEDIRSASKIEFNANLNYNGNNLAQVLHTLLTNDRTKFIEIENIMKELIPEIKEINVPPIKQQDSAYVYISIRENSLYNQLKQHSISDGTLRLLAFVTALYLDVSFISFEEPENCIHPFLFESLIDIIKKSPVQVTIITHSPYLLSQVKTKEIRLFNKIKGRTIINEVDNIEDVEAILREGIPLGEIWYTGRLKNISE